jgi:hypothetical protein
MLPLLLLLATALAAPLKPQVDAAVAPVAPASISDEIVAANFSDILAGNISAPVNASTLVNTSAPVNTSHFAANPPAPVFADERAAVGWAPTFKNYNDWSCKSTDKLPVVLLHGLTAEKTVNWFALGPPLAADGHCVFTPQYGTRMGVLFG